MSDDKNDLNWVQTVSEMWKGLPIRYKFHAFALVLVTIVACAMFARTADVVPVAIVVGLLALLVIPIVAESLVGLRGNCLPITSSESLELQQLCDKIQEMERKTSLLFQVLGPRRFLEEFPNLIPIEGADTGGIVARYARIHEDQAERRLQMVGDIVRRLNY